MQWCWLFTLPLTSTLILGTNPGFINSTSKLTITYTHCFQASNYH